MRKERKKREKKELAFLIQQKKSWSGTRYVFFYTYFVACCPLCSLATTTSQNWIFEPIQRLWCVSGDGGSCGGEMVVVRRVQVLVVVSCMSICTWVYVRNHVLVYSSTYQVFLHYTYCCACWLLYPLATMTDQSWIQSLQKMLWWQ